MYVDILRVLARKGPLKLTHVMYKANVNCKVLKGYLDYLLKHGLVEMRIVGKASVVFVVTQRGITVLKYFHEQEYVESKGSPTSQVPFFGFYKIEVAISPAKPSFLFSLCLKGLLTVQ